MQSEARKAYYAEWAKNNADKRNAARKRWLEKNPEKMHAARVAWEQRNPHRKAEGTRRQQARRLNAVPAWASPVQMADFYKIARDLTAATGVKVEVDHIVPLQSPLVCGLHCEQNLRISTMAENRAKRNHYWPDMP